MKSFIDFSLQHEIYVLCSVLLFISEKPPKIFTVTLTIIDRIFVDDYKDLTKPLTLGLIEDLKSIFKPFLEQNLKGFSTIVFTGFFQGSVGVIFDVTFAATSEINAANIVKALTRANGTNQLRFELFGTINAVNKLHTSTGATDSVVTGLYLLSQSDFKSQAVVHKKKKTLYSEYFWVLS